jgi:hypothetical protein
MRKEAESEPPSCLRQRVFMMGQDSQGNWVVRDQSGDRGGLFVGRAEALRYVRFESGDRPSSIVMVSEAFELYTNGRRRPPMLHQFSAGEGRTRRVA